ncbi:hypothetical protein PoB_004264100 [Plakobranchus ocellatus]|uniref:Uncharacterized protein n=1 Tax=Plakobranchus ocellatus TaxID=259542 RepID=A0AAV4AYF9_9GAST|nr:hypothetical protein PoB_004264100 [Plakobranchus ocellatus]
MLPKARWEHWVKLSTLSVMLPKARWEHWVGSFSVALKSAAASRRQFIPATAWFEGGEGGAKLIWLEPKVFRDL